MSHVKQTAIRRTLEDYGVITIGLILYAIGWAVFLLPYKIVTGGTSGIGAILEYSFGIKLWISQAVINAVLLGIALKILGPKFGVKTLYGIGMLVFLLWLFPTLLEDENGVLPQFLGEGQDFMATVMGAGVLGTGIGLIFTRNGSTGGTDIISLIINKYRDISLGKLMMYCDIVIVLSCYFIYHDVKRVLFGFSVMFIMGFVIDYIINRSKQSVQFFIFSKKYEEVADAICRKANRGVTLLDGQGWYSKQPIKVILVVAREEQSLEVYRQIIDIDPEAFISQANVEGVYGLGFEKLKLKK